MSADGAAGDWGGVAGGAVVCGERGCDGDGVQIVFTSGTTAEPKGLCTRTAMCW